MTNPDELERAVERLERMIGPELDKEPTTSADLRLILSANREMREALERIAHPEYGIGFNRLRGLARSALTTQRGDGE